MSHPRQVALTILDQIGRGNFLAISGGRYKTENSDGPGQDLILPVSNGYQVRVHLEWNDTYTVTREFVRSGVVSVKGRQTDVYCDEVSEVAYQAHAFRSNPFGEDAVA